VKELAIPSTLTSDWKTIRFRYVASTSKGRLPIQSQDQASVESGGVPYLSMEYLRGNSEPTEFVSSEGMVKTEDGDILLLWDGSNAGEFIRAKYGAVSSTAALVSPIKFNRDYLFWLCKGIEPILKTFTNGMGIPHVDGEILKNLRIPFPSDESYRQAITNFLNSETLRIDALVAEKEKMLALLEEKRAALISRAVTRGLDPSAPLKPSSLDWLGDIPAHWEVWKLKYVVEKIGSGITPRGGAESYQLEGIPLFRSQNIHFDGLRMDDIVYVDAETHESMSNSKVLEGDVLINITGASIGRCFYVENLQGEANVNQHVCIVRPAPKIETKFLYFTLRSDVGQHQIDLSQSGSGREGLNFESLGNFSVVIPPLSEQLAIIQRLETSGNRSTELLNEIRNTIERLKERRAALITAAVTGQIPVEEMRS